MFKAPNSHKSGSELAKLRGDRTKYDLIINKAFIKFSYLLIYVLTALFFLQSCNENRTIKSIELNNKQTLKNGEWLSLSDSLSGVSIRENKIAFFKKMEFNSEDICKYTIIDSIYKNGKSKKRIGTFLLVIKNKDTTKYIVLKRSEKSIVLKIEDKKETYNFWR